MLDYENVSEFNPVVIQVDIYDHELNSFADFLEYIYVDRVDSLSSLSNTKRKALNQIAEAFGCPSLSTLCERKDNIVLKRNENLLLSSTFSKDLKCLFDNSDPFVDIVILVEGLETPQMLFSHRFILCRFKYFFALISGSFGERNLTINGRTYTAITMDPMFNIYTTRVILLFLYTGLCDFQMETIEEVMHVLICASLIDIYDLQIVCENFISSHLDDCENNIHNCLQFAANYNISRLVKQCEILLTKSKKVYNCLN